MPSASDVARISSAAQSDVGRTRSENQDAFGEFESPSGERLFVVADGMGGHRGGATASRLCVETLGRTFTDGTDPAEERLRRGFELANARIHAAAQTDQELAGMGTTAVALVLAPDGSGTLGWVGDSRAYRFSGGSLERLSTDHSVVGEMIRAGVITEEEAESHPRRNELLRAIGPHDFVEAETLALRHSPGDRFLLCSDGLWGPVPEAELAIVLGFETPELAVKKLIAKANERGGPDNVTAQIASVADPAADLPLATPIFAPGSDAPARSSRIPLLVSGAAVAALALLALAVYGLRSSQSEVDQIMAAAAEKARALEAPTPAPPTRVAPPSAAPAPAVKVLPPEPTKQPPKAAAALAPTKPEPKAEPKAKPVEPKPAVAAPPKPAAPQPVVVAKAPVEKPAPPKPAPAKPESPKPAPEKPAVQKPAPEPAVVAAPPPPVVAAVPPPEPPPAPEAKPQELSRVEVEQFLLDWETAISSKDFALYSRLGLPGNEQAFKTRYVENAAKIDFSLRDFDKTDPDQLIVRVQMVLETQDPTGPRRVDQERRFVVKQTPEGLRYIGLPKK